MTTSDFLDDFAPAWVAALNELRDVARSETVNTVKYTYRYATLAAAAQQARDVLGKHDLAVNQSSHASGIGAVAVSTRVWHKSGQWAQSDELVMPAPGGPQDVGSAISYARRYSLMSFLGLATEDDDGADAQAAATAPAPSHPLSERVAVVMAAMKALDDSERVALKEWADGRRLSGAALLDNEPFLTELEEWLSVRAAGSDRQGSDGS